ncbi:hypothetical protein KVR01_000747 [Diaporthe batatas]|uniref:uncharacterized protein n=1 Tax=Diaporthe batatas TaxID=748121 RepID=UPI001D04340C|nr:uncharacterized protein KVR01_000747 [Diaporthe batatas]KAG8170002.1 hypothetical protein KVR01_000747 [Diaporthe batatas]
MLSRYIAVVAPFLAGTCLAQECAYRGWGTGVDIGFYGDPLSATQAACNSLCNANSACLSFSYNTAGPNCILYDYAVEGNAVYDPASPNNFFNRGNVCPAIPTPAPTSTQPIPTAAPTCTGYPGWDTGANIGFYPDAYSASYGGCLALCDANEACLSFGILSTPACALYNYTVEGNDVYDPNSANTFYNKGGVCPATPTSTAPPVPTQTGLFPNCPAGIVPYNINTGATPYSPCNSAYPYSSCQSDVDGTAYCNLCLTCTTQTCATDADCGEGYACIENSACAVAGVATGAPVCLYMLAGGPGCYA